MMLRTRSLFAILALLVLFAAPGAAQVQRVPNTGCPNAPYPTPVGAPAIGQGFGIIAAPCRTATGIPFLVLGVPGLMAILPDPPACMRGCVVACRPVVILPVAAWRTVIPNDPNLIGARMCAQSGCVENPPLCVYLHGALDIRITP